MATDRPMVCLSVRDNPFDGPVLERLIAALGTRIDMPLERMDDARLVAAAVLAEAWPASSGAVLTLALTIVDDHLRLDVGPLHTGGAERIVAATSVPGVGPVVERLSRGWEARSIENGQENLDIALG